MCSALYCVILTLILLFASRRIVRGISARCALPNQFRCQTSIASSFFAKKPSPEALETCSHPSVSGGANLFLGCRHPIGGSNPETVIKSNEIEPSQLTVLRAAAPCNGGGAERDRTVDPLLAKQVLSQLSYSPTSACVQGEYGGPG
jgi:hypothetical protein